VAIAGAHGKVGRRLTRRLVSRGFRVRGLIRDPDQADDLRADGAEPVVCDLEASGVSEIARAILGANAVVFAAGAGPGSGAARKWTMDRDGAIKLMEAAREAKIRRYEMVSSTGAEDPPDGDDVFSVYLRAKAEADQALMSSELLWTIVRPGLLGDEAGDGRVRIDDQPLRGNVPRDDVADVLGAVLPEPRAVERTLYVVDGDEPVEWELEAALTRPHPAGAQPG
jgi:nucleoside-diphosphate-sugar epimerase